MYRIKVRHTLMLTHTTNSSTICIYIVSLRTTARWQVAWLKSIVVVLRVHFPSRKDHCHQALIEAISKIFAYYKTAIRQ